jgi:hypothetical protein
MKDIRTRIVLILLIVATLTTAMAMAHLSSAKRQAADSARDLSLTRQYLADIRSSLATNTHPIVGATPASQLPANNPAPTATQLQGGEAFFYSFRQAAVATAASGKLTSIEPGQPARIEGTDYQETPIFLRLEAMPMKQLVSFLYESCARDAKARCRSIELSAAPASYNWSADVTISYLSYSPRGESK